MKKDRGGKPRFLPQSFWLWTGASAGGAWAGAHLALSLFPLGGFGRNPTGQFGWYLVGFALTIGLCYATAQFLVLLHVARLSGTQSSKVLLLWVPATALGIAWSIFPLWWIDAWALTLGWLAVFVPMLPGFIVLGMTQWGVLHWAIGMGRDWLATTIVGAAIGSVAGLAAALVIYFYMPGNISTLLPPETIWAVVMGGCIAAFQGQKLIPRLRGEQPRDPE